VDLESIVAGVLDGVSLTVRADLRAAPAIGEPVLLERLCDNVVDNAVRHNRPGGFIEVATGVEDGHAFLRIGNSGAPVTDVDRLREPFVRGAGGDAPAARSGNEGCTVRPWKRPCSTPLW
jgi:signal transduction histidine kinase